MVSIPSALRGFGNTSRVPSVTVQQSRADARRRQTVEDATRPTHVVLPESPEPCCRWSGFATNSGGRGATVYTLALSLVRAGASPDMRRSYACTRAATCPEVGRRAGLVRGDVGGNGKPACTGDVSVGLATTPRTPTSAGLAASSRMTGVSD